MACWPLWRAALMCPTGAGGTRIVVLCEGDTEELAVRHFVARQLQVEGLASVALHRVNLRGRLQDIGIKTRLFLEEQQVAAVFTLIDLYGMDRVQHRSTDALDVKIERVRKWLRAQVDRNPLPRFFPHLAVHETEAWILAEGSALARRLNDPGIRPDPDAELKDFQKPPCDRINELFLSRKHGDRYQKIRDGRPLFATMQFEPVYRSCGYFRRFYDDLKTVAARGAL